MDAQSLFDRRAPAKPDKSWAPYPVTVHTTGDPSLLSAALRATWPDGVCTDTGIYFQPSVEIPMLQAYTRGVRFAIGRVSARAVIPQILDVLAGGCDLSPIVERLCRGKMRPRRGRR